MTEQELLPVKEIVGSVDVLFTQFSYASWWGNADDRNAWQLAAKEQLEKVGREIRVLSPKKVLLGASFVYFCHEENAYMNQFANRVKQAFDYVAAHGTKPIALYPGDTWETMEDHDSTRALGCYLEDENLALSDPIRVKTTVVSLSTLVQEADSFLTRLRRMNSRILLRKLEPIRIFLIDHAQSVELALDGLKPTIALERDCHIALSSSALKYCFRFDWGGETLGINGRFRVPSGADKSIFFRWFSIASANSRGTYYDLSYYARKVISRCLPDAKKWTAHG